MEYQAPPEVIELNKNESEDVFFKDHKLISSNPKNIINEDTSDGWQPYGANRNRNSYKTFGAGTFIRGRWNPKPFGDCNAWRGCFKRLEGVNFFGTYTKEILRKGVWSFDYDITGMVGSQSTNQNYLYEEIEYSSGTFAVFGLIPTLRISKLGNKIPIGLGLGIGPSYSLGSRVVEKPYDFSKLLSQINAEVNIPISKESDTSIVLGLSHVCTFLGILENEDGKRFGHQWYTVGIRRRL